MPWYVGSNESNFTLGGQESAEIVVTLVHPTPPLPGTYRIDLLGIDVDNGVNYPYMLYFIVPDLPNLRLEYDYQIVPVSPTEPTSIDIRLFNIGNANIGYDLFLEAPAGWDAGFDTLSSVPGASSGSTGLITKDTHRDIGMSFTPPQVMTGAGAERMVRLTAISQTEVAESWVFDIPIKVDTVKAIDIDLESNLGVLRPDSSFSMLFALEHRGNVDLSLTPSFELPSGWAVTSGMEAFDLPWTSSKNLLFGISGDGTGSSGQVKLHLDSGSDRMTWTGEFNVELLAQPTINFVQLAYGGQTWDTPFGPGSHPTGVPLQFTWLIGNEANVQWQPTASVSLSSGLFGECSTLEAIGQGDLKPVTCTVIISSSMEPLSEPSFVLKLAGDEVESTQNIGLLVATVVESAWQMERTTQLTTGAQEQIQVTLTNVGNTAYSHKIVVDGSKDWKASIDGNDVLNLESGESTKIRLLVRADRPGDGSITLALQGAEQMTNSSFTFSLSAVGEPTGTSGQSLPVGAIGVGALLVALLIVGLFLSRRKSESDFTIDPSSKFTAPLVTVPPVSAVPQTSATVHSPTCWSCRQAITGPMLGCPGCGARYHRKEVPSCTSNTLQQCVNCNASTSTFVHA